jgi:hypothetical protein
MYNFNVRFLVVTVLLFVGSASYSQKLIPVVNEAFKPGEKLKFRVHFGFIDAGEVTMEIDDKYEKFASRSCLHIVGLGKTKGAFDWFFKIRDRYETYLDQEASVPWFFVRRVQEGGFKLSEDVTFNQYKNTSTSPRGTFPVPPQIQDLISAYYFSRTFNTTNIKIGDILPISAFIDDVVFPLNIKFVGKEAVRTNLGKINCLKFRPMLEQGRVFKESEKMTLWISDDKNHIPIRLEAEIIVGSIKMDLMEYSGLVNPLQVDK